MLACTRINGELYVNLGKESGGKKTIPAKPGVNGEPDQPEILGDRHTFCAFTGKIDKEDYDNLRPDNIYENTRKYEAGMVGGAREGFEESGGLLPKPKDLYNKMKVFSNHIFMYEVDNMEQLSNEKFHANIKAKYSGKGYGCYREMSEIRWVKAADLVDACVNNQGRMMINGKEERIRPFFQRTVINNQDKLTADYLDIAPLAKDRLNEMIATEKAHAEKQAEKAAEKDLTLSKDKSAVVPPAASVVLDNSKAPVNVNNNEAAQVEKDGDEMLKNVKKLNGNLDNLVGEFKTKAKAKAQNKDSILSLLNDLLGGIAKIAKDIFSSKVLNGKKVTSVNNNPKPQRVRPSPSRAKNAAFNPVKIDSLSKINPQSLNKDTLVIYDVNGTLVKGNSQRKGSPLRTVEKATAEIMKKLKRVNGNKTFLAVTKAKFNEKHRLDKDVEKKGIPLSRYRFDKMNDTRLANNGVFKNGMLYTNNNDKGEALKEFLSKASVKYKNIVVVDDNLENLESIHKALGKDIPVTTYHMVGAHKHAA